MFNRTVAALARLVGLPLPSDPTVSPERRRTPRHACEVETTFQCLNPPSSEHFPAHIRDISALGVQLLVAQSFRKGELLSLTLPASAEQASTAVLCYVVRVAPQTGGQFVLGCTFAQELSEQDLRPFGAVRASSPPSDSRRWLRSPCDVPVEFHEVRDRPSREQAHIVDISPNGCGLVVKRTLPMGALISLHSAGMEESCPFTMLASVVRISPRGQDDWLLGCTFLRELQDHEFAGLLANADRASMSADKNS
jgi:hypothetical protein